MEQRTIQPNPFVEELKKFIKSQAVVEQHIDGKVIATAGIIKAIDFNHLNVIVMTDTEKILIKNFYRIKRKREGK